jgi:hypothetical protein
MKKRTAFALGVSPWEKTRSRSVFEGEEHKGKRLRRVFA